MCIDSVATDPCQRDAEMHSVLCALGFAQILGPRVSEDTARESSGRAGVPPFYQLIRN